MSAMDQAFDGLRTMIRSGRLRPGQRLPSETELCAELEVSRGPLREAMKMLGALGVLEARQGSGTYVSQLRADDLLGGLLVTIELLPLDGLLDLYELRRVLEGHAAAQASARATPEQRERLAHLASLDSRQAAEALGGSAGASQSDAPDIQDASSLDRELHALIATAAHNPALAALLGVFRTAGSHYQLFADETAAPLRAISARAHTEMVAAICAGDPSRASAAAEAHVAQTEEWLRTLRPPSADAATP